MKKLAIITTHPIQYNAPLFALLSERGNIKVRVFYTWGKKVLDNKFDPGFQRTVAWDIPLLEGYEYCFVENVAPKPGSHHFWGIDNPAIFKELDKWNPDALLVYGWAFKSHLKVIRYYHKRKPVFFRGDSVETEKEGILKTLFRHIYLGWVYRHIDVALYTGTLNKRYFEKHGLPESRLVFAPHAVDNARFQGNEPLKHEAALSLRKELGISPEELVFLYAGKLDHNKNVSQLLEVFSGIGQKNVHLLIAGNGELEKELKSQFGSFKNIHFLPFQNQGKMPVIYRVADVFVLPSLTETWGLSINEAMACGCALLVSNRAGASADLVKEGENGITFDPHYARDLQKKIAIMIERKTEMKNWGAYSRLLIGDWSYQKDCEIIEKLLT